MSGPEDGTYRIQLAVVPNPLIGVDDVPVIPKPVITEGANNVVSPLVFVLHQRHLYRPFNSPSSFFICWNNLLNGPSLFCSGTSRSWRTETTL